jgi:hypothetical protein
MSFLHLLNSEIPLQISKPTHKKNIIVIAKNNNIILKSKFIDKFDTEIFLDMIYFDSIYNLYFTNK